MALYGIEPWTVTATMAAASPPNASAFAPSRASALI